jgi:RecA-family ATPase
VKRDGELQQLLDSTLPPETPESTGLGDFNPVTPAAEEERLIWMAERKSRNIEWLWEGRIPLGKCTLLVGDPDSGKSFVALDLAARISRGVGVEPERGLAGPGRVLLLAADDDVDDTILPRLEMAGADLSRVALLPSFVSGRGVARSGDRPQRSGTRPGSQRLLSLSCDIERVEAALEEVSDCRLIVVDPISAYLRGVDGNNNVTVRQLLLKLAGVARRHGAAMLLVPHHRKASAPTAMYRAIGSLAFTAVARVVLMVTADAAVAGRRLLLPVKMTLQTSATGRAFAIDAGRVVWEPETVPYTADELAVLERSGEASIDFVREAVEWLKSLLGERKRMPAEEVLQKARERKLSRAMLFAAKKRACIKAVRDGKEQKWYWERIMPWHQGVLPDDEEWEQAIRRARQ